MITYTDKNRDVKNTSPVKNTQNGISQFFKTVDNRSEAIQQRKTKSFINGSSLMVAQQKTIQRILNSATGNYNNVYQLAGKEEEKLQLKSDVHQLAEKEEEKLQLKSNIHQLAGKEEEKLQLKSAVHQLEEKEEEKLQLKSKDVHQLASKEEEKLQMKSQNDSSSLEMPVQKKENNTGLPDNLKSGVENLSGMSMDHVKVHYGSEKPAQLNALAYAQGSDIHVASGQEKHVPHEAWHVVQQMQGRVQPTVQMNEVSINDDPSLETEADVMGAKALETK